MNVDLICLILSYETSSELTTERLVGGIHDIKIVNEYSIKKNKKNVVYTDILNIPKSRSWENFEKELDEIKNDKIIFYYSGHFKNNNFILPNGKNIQFSILIKKLNDKFKKCFIILDCCFCESVCLQYLSIGDGLIKDNYCNVRTTSENKIVILYSLNQEGFIYSSSLRGSLFTQKIFDIIMKNSRTVSFSDITTQKFDNNTKAIFYSTHPNILHLWKWINN